MRLGTFRVVWPETALSFNIHCQALGGDNLVTAGGPRVQAREAGPRETAGNERPRLTPHPPESRHIDGDSPTRSSGNRHAEMNRERSRGKGQLSHEGGVNGTEKNRCPVPGNEVFRTPEPPLAPTVDPLQLPLHLA